RAPFLPRRTAGFFYYHRPKDLPFTASAIRFRIAAVNPKTFAKGADLLRPDGAPWEVPLSRIISKRSPKLLEQLLRDRLITDVDLEQSAMVFPGNRARLLHRFGDLFPISFEGMHYLQIVCGETHHRLDVRVFHEQRGGMSSAVHPYSGRALVRFELSTLPEYASARVVVLRLVKMIDPPTLRLQNYDGYLPPPIEGELVQRPR
ncbi:hypothetical protein C8R43DRAFT_842363, partial [Mycena crocata]